MINVCFAGITGWTAPPIIAAIDAASDLALTAGVSRSAAGHTLTQAVGSASAAAVYASVAEALASAPIDVLVDYTSATAVRQNVWTAVQRGVHAVVGSSGLTAAEYKELDALARERTVGVIAAGNFSALSELRSSPCRCRTCSVQSRRAVQKSLAAVSTRSACPASW